MFHILKFIINKNIIHISGVFILHSFVPFIYQFCLQTVAHFHILYTLLCNFIKRKLPQIMSLRKT